jgi:PAS domain-containing protein
MTLVQNDTLIRQINENFLRLSGKPLYAPPVASDAAVADVHQWLHEEAPYGILAHNIDADPRFIYANRHALASFKYTPDEILAVPSRQSASEQDRPERQRMLEIVLRDGIVYNYSGPRVDKYGNSFTIYDGIVWQLRNTNGEVWGQAALFWTDEVKRPEWFEHLRN